MLQPFSVQAVGQNIFSIFGIFEIWHVAADQVYFYWLNSKIQYLQIWLRALAAHIMHMPSSFHFQKITESLRKYFILQFFKYLLFTSMNNRQKENWKLHFYKNFFPDSPKCMGKSVFDLVKGKTNFLKFLFIFKIKESIPPWRRLQKCYLKKYVLHKIVTKMLRASAK